MIQFSKLTYPQLNYETTLTCLKIAGCTHMYYSPKHIYSIKVETINT